MVRPNSLDCMALNAKCNKEIEKSGIKESKGTGRVFLEASVGGMRKRKLEEKAAGKLEGTKIVSGGTNYT